LQRYGPRDPRSAASVRELDDEIGRLLDYFKREDDPRIVILSEYGISPVSKPVHLNRVLRENGFLAIRNELGHELLDAGASAAFAVADHQIAHVYVNDSVKFSALRALIENEPGVMRVYSPD